MDQIKWGILGCGNVTEVKSGPAFSKVANSSLAAVMRRDAEKAADYAQRHHVPKWYADADALINDPEVNAIYIATPPDAHEELAIKAIRAGKPVYIEKPMARNAAECERIIEAGKKAGVPVFVAYYRRALDYFLKVKELVDSGIIGDVRYVSICLQWQPYEEEVGENARPRWRVTPEISGGGHFHDLASHQFDFLEFVFGPVKTAQGISRNQAGLYEADDIVMASFEFESGVLGNGSWCFTIDKAQRQDEARITGSKGKITFSFFEKFDIIVENEAGTNVMHIPYPEHVQQPLIDLIVKELRGEGKSPSNGDTGIRASRIMDEICTK
ncbi:Gfo/Idh/MocA family protein [Dyadobacter sediminis]|uniref:Gfo/Idh/MocA family oxidoreductase n=1 Tax=Dyadobacter sediminis TaxID=1493691 RepID=A0A5R9KJF1_9BACT|nr:Gfo/Idh/MocA family oxidoreductase [Dyadobacter sediminis]TLU96347.1 Gfo/Idh/MocA family oxidoreductase [Dyadobacter sediminis]GGB81486.1 oxidoreductase [Dyadobacter sediminis]